VTLQNHRANDFEHGEESRFATDQINKWPGNRTKPRGQPEFYAFSQMALDDTNAVSVSKLFSKSFTTWLAVSDLSPHDS
jgi:hypothetical protein